MSESLVFPRHVHSTIPDGIASEIQRQIAAGALKDGDRLPSVETLAADFGVSRTSIREALRGLAALGIVTIQHGRGSFVCADIAKIDGYNAWIHEQQYALQELCEFRAAVETTAARLAAVKATDQESLPSPPRSIRCAGPSAISIRWWSGTPNSTPRSSAARTTG